MGSDKTFKIPETGSLSTRKHICPFWEILPRVPVRVSSDVRRLRRQHAPCAVFPVSANCTRRSPLGSHRKKSLIRKHLLPTAAVPALAGMAAVVCLAPQAQAEPAPAHAAVRTAEPATVADATSHAGMSTADLLAVVRQSGGHAQKAQPDHYTIRSGDSLSKIAGKVYHKQNAWPVLYWAN